MTFRTVRTALKPPPAIMFVTLFTVPGCTVLQKRKIHNWAQS